MPRRTHFLVAAGISCLWLVGCGGKTQPVGQPVSAQHGFGAAPIAAQPIANEQRVTLHVAGMTKLQGITWLGWPNRVQEALAGLPGVASIDVDLKKDLFRIVYDAAQVNPQRMLETVSDSGFEGETVESAVAEATPAKVRRDLSALPALDEWAQTAKESGKPLLLAFHGPGWLPCLRMDTVTYPNAQVQEELARWVLVKLDVVEQPEVAKRFEVVGVPTAVAVTADGDELGRVENFVEPGPFREKLTGFRE